MKALGCRLHAVLIAVFCFAPLTNGLNFWQAIGLFILGFAVTSVVWGEWDWVMDEWAVWESKP